MSCSATSGDWRDAALLRVKLREARLTGLDLGEAKLREVRLVGCKLDYANLRFAAVEHVTFAAPSFSACAAPSSTRCS